MKSGKSTEFWMHGGGGGGILIATYIVNNTKLDIIYNF